MYFDVKIILTSSRHIIEQIKLANSPKTKLNMHNLKIFNNLVPRILYCVLRSLIHKLINVFLMSKEF